MELDPNLVAIVTSLASIVLGIIAKKYKSQKDEFVGLWSTANDKIDQAQAIANKIIEAAKDDKITEQEFQGIISGIETIRK